MHTFLSKSPDKNGAPSSHRPFFTPRIQAKMTVSQPGDEQEQQANAMADRVMRASAEQPFFAPSALHRKNMQPDKEQKENIQRQADKEEAQRKASANSGRDFTASPAVASQISATKGGGNPLPAGTRQFMEGQFGADFSGVRIHTGDTAAGLNRDLNAHAFTHGQDVYFNSGKYAPERGEGKRLLAHELTHVVQQGDVSNPKTIARKELNDTDYARTGKTVGQGTVVVDSLNIRKGPGTKYDKTGKPLKKGAVVTLYGETGGWYCIGNGMWVSGQYILKNTAMAALSGIMNTVKEIFESALNHKTAADNGPATSLNGQLVFFIAHIKQDATYGKKVYMTSGVRSPKTEAWAVLNHQRDDSNYYKIFSGNWQTAILNAIKGRDLKVAADFDAAVNSLEAWISEAPVQRSPHYNGKAVDFSTAGGDTGFRDFLKKEAEARNFKFIDESKYKHYHIQMP